MTLCGHVRSFLSVDCRSGIVSRVILFPRLVPCGQPASTLLPKAGRLSFLILDVLQEVQVHFPPFLGPKPLSPGAFTQAPKTFILKAVMVCSAFVYPCDLKFALALAPFLLLTPAMHQKHFLG